MNDRPVVLSQETLAKIVSAAKRAEAAEQRIVSEEYVEHLAELVAERVLDALRERDEGPPMLTPAEAGRRLGKSAQWVRDHREELGVVELGSGTRPRLGVPAERLAAYIACSSGRRTDEAENGTGKPKGGRRRSAKKPPLPDLLPVRGKAPR